MNEFRQALDAHAEGRVDLSGVERELNVGLTRQPHLAAAHGALVEALYRSGRLGGESYLALIKAIRSFQQSQPSRVTVNVVPNAPAAPGAADKTQFRAPATGRSGSSTAATLGGSAGAGSSGTAGGTASNANSASGSDGAPAAFDTEKTQFRAPRAVASTSALAPSPSAPTGTDGFRVAIHPTDSRMPTGSRPTSSSWNDELGRSVAEGTPLGTGSVVKDRFVLEEELGRGGMGIVFKARDLRKEEAQDRNPWVALKLLNDEFRRHPESLKALQRESRKAQHLAHANVVTVYDFDRDGGNVFMVMELLEGESVDRIIRDNEGSGVGNERALRLTRDLCRAMAYAHEQGVVHSDFKPANAFLTKENVVKVFDFGIARAAKRADNISGSTTLFDPGTLGALTPTYASCEMIEGLEPDSRDDVYAIACVAYELFTGKHPFNRVSAVEARDKRMVAKKPRGLKRHQWRAIQHGLEFSRENRTTSAQQFLNELIPKPGRPTVPIAVGAVVVIALVVAGLLVPNYLAKRRDRELMDSLAAADSQRLDALVQALRALPPEQRATILLNDGARAGLIKAFEARINAATDVRQAHTDYPAARALLDELQAFLPDSLAVKDLQDRLVARENDEIKRLSDRFDTNLARGSLIDAQGPENIGTALTAIRRIDAQNRLLSDPRLPGAFAEQTRKALQAGDATLAQALVVAGLAFDAKDTMLTDLRDQVLRAFGTQQLLARRKTLETSLAALTGAQASFTDIDAKRAELDELRGIAPDSAVLATVQQLAQRGVSAQTAQLVSAGNHAQALELVAKYADLLPASFVDQQRQQLASARGAFEVREAAVTQIKGHIDALLASPRTDAAWGTQFDRELRQLGAYVSSTDSYVAQVHARVATAYLEQARTLRASQRLTEAGRLVDQARAYAPQLADVAAESKLLADARTAQETDARQRNRQAQLDALKTKLLVQARANEVNEALASYQELRANLDTNDGYIVVQAPEAIGNAYLRLASNAARDGRFPNAVTLTARAKEISPDLADVTPAAERYSRYQSIDQALRTGVAVDAAAIRAELDRLARQDEGEAAAVNERFARSLVARIRAMPEAAAKRLTAVAHALFSDQPAVKALSQPTDDHAPAAVPQAVPAAQPATSGATNAPGKCAPGSGSGVGIGAGAGAGAGGTSADAPGGTHGASIDNGVASGDCAPGLASAAGAASAGTSSGGGSTNVSPATSSPSRAGAQPATRVASLPSGQSMPGTAVVSGPRLAPEIPCTNNLAGYGKRRQAVCYDTFDGGGRGPDLVVIPAGGAVTKSFALGRFEISNADFSLYCSRTSKCKAPTEAAEYPVTRISLDDARGYVAWLSQASGVVYRLPTDAEWSYAVTAQGATGDVSSVNCLVEIGGKKIRGVALEPVQSGSANGWGVYNALGNAQEFVTSGAAVVARGGAFSDNMSSCNVDSKRVHSGAADALTGLRVVRELP